MLTWPNKLNLTHKKNLNCNNVIPYITFRYLPSPRKINFLIIGYGNIITAKNNLYKKKSLNENKKIINNLHGIFNTPPLVWELCWWFSGDVTPWGPSWIWLYSGSWWQCPCKIEKPLNVLLPTPAHRREEQLLC